MKTLFLLFLLCGTACSQFRNNMWAPTDTLAGYTNVKKATELSTTPDVITGLVGCKAWAREHRPIYRRHLIKVVFTITYDSLTFSEAAKVENLVHRKFIGENCKIGISTQDVRPVDASELKIRPWWQYNTLVTPNQYPLDKK